MVPPKPISSLEKRVMTYFRIHKNMYIPVYYIYFLFIFFKQYYNSNLNSLVFHCIPVLDIEYTMASL